MSKEQGSEEFAVITEVADIVEQPPEEILFDPLFGDLGFLDFMLEMMMGNGLDDFPG